MKVDSLFFVSGTVAAVTMVRKTIVNSRRWLAQMTESNLMIVSRHMNEVGLIRNCCRQQCTDPNFFPSDWKDGLDTDSLSS
jgi:hypothetical protein